MTDRRDPSASDVEIDIRALLMSLLRALPYLIVFAGLLGGTSFYFLSRLPPTYEAETLVLIESGQSAALDNESMTSQIQLIRSRDVARSVAQKVDLAGRPEYQDAIKETSLLGDVLARFGLAEQPSDSSAEERLLAKFYDNLQVSTIAGSRVIAIEFSSIDAKLAADGANAVAAEYIALRRAAKEDTTADATSRLESEIADLRVKIRNSGARSKPRPSATFSIRILVATAMPSLVRTRTSSPRRPALFQPLRFRSNRISPRSVR